MPTIAELLRESAALDSDSPLLDTQLLLGHVLGCNRSYLFTWPEKPVSESDAAAFRGLLARRARGVPVAHLLGCQEFWSLPLQVSPATLIPRPDTEILVELSLQLPLPEQARVLDLGTGTGAIALALASERPAWTILAVDSEADAVALAVENRERLQLANVAICQSNWFAHITGQFDLIVSNPPYVAEDDIHLAQGDVRFEPKSALVADANGLADLHHIIVVAQRFLVPGGFLCLEHGAAQGGAVRQLMVDRGYADVTTRRDLGDRERVTCGQQPVTSPDRK